MKSKSLALTISTPDYAAFLAYVKNRIQSARITAALRDILPAKKTTQAS